MTKQPRHRAGETPSSIDDLLTGSWHVGRSWPGVAPAIERQCPCPKAECGLAVPTADVDCDQHKGGKPLRQVHKPEQCKKPRRFFWKKS